jgi:hypothetical protein
MRYWSGLITGVVASAIGLLALLTGWLVPRLVDQVPELTTEDVPRATSMVTSAGWAVAAPAALVLLLLAATIVPRRRETVRVVALILVLVASAAVIAFTVMGMSVALSDLTLQIRAG